MSIRPARQAVVTIVIGIACAVLGCVSGGGAMAAQEGDVARPWVRETEEGIQAGNGLVGLAFARRGNAILLRSVTREPGGRELLTGSRETDSLWELEFATAAGERITLSSADAPGATFDARAGDDAEITIRWPQVTDGGSRVGVEVRVVIKRGDPVTYWSLRLANADETLRPWRVTFPIIANVDGIPGTKLAFPTGWGIVYDDALHAGEIQGTYPSMTPAMQFMACWQRAGGVYFAAHDPAAAHKQLICTPDVADGRLRLAVVNYPAGMGRPVREWTLPYQAAVGVFPGNWYDAARLHRAWAIEHAPWMAKGELLTRRSTPKWLKDIDIWCLGGGGPAEAVEPAKRFAEYFGVPTAVHWYNWHQIPFDDHYPEYFPTKAGFAQGVAELQAAGVRVMPYINGRLWDPRTDTWTSENAEAACAKNEHMKRYEETYGSGVPLVVMCPYTEQWQAKVAGLVDRLVHECGVDGVYVDQISAAGAKVCFDPHHGHPVGGGSFWAEGYRRLLERARKTLPKGGMLTTEESADPWIDLLDAFLLVNTSPHRGEVVPLFPAVYGGRTITFGFQYMVGDDLDRGMPFRAKMARAFAWGAQLGWVGPQILDEKYAREAEYLRALAQCRRRAHEFLALGEMLKPPTVRGARRVTIEGGAPWGGDYRISLPAVISSAWRAANGDVGIALTNMTDEEQTARFSLGGRGLGLPRERGYSLTRITPAGEERIGEIARAAGVHEEVVPPRSAAVVRISAGEG